MMSSNRRLRTIYLFFVSNCFLLIMSLGIVPAIHAQDGNVLAQKIGADDYTFSGVIDLQGRADDNGAPARLSEAEWAQIKSQLPKPAAASPDTESAILHASDAQAGAEFGYSVSISGDTLVVGATLDGNQHHS